MNTNIDLYEYDNEGKTKNHLVFHDIYRVIGFIEDKKEDYGSEQLRYKIYVKGDHTPLYCFQIRRKKDIEDMRNFYKRDDKLNRFKVKYAVDEQKPETLKDWVREQFEDVTLNDICSHGCIVGFCGLTTYKDTNDLYDQYHEEMWELAAEQCDGINGNDNLLAFFGTFNGATSVCDDVRFKNLMVWYAAEEYARQIVEETEEDNQDDEEK